MTFKLDMREFKATLNKYKELSKRDPATICNTKAFYIARRAVIETPKADKSQMQAELGRIIRIKKLQVQKLRTVTRYGRFGQQVEAPLVALIINSRRGQHGEAGLYGSSMESAVTAFLNARFKSIAFLKSGWLPAIRALEPFAEKIGGPRLQRGPTQVGAAKGSGTPAKDGFWTTKATIENSAGDNRNNKGALIKYGAPALQRAFDAESASMLQYMEKKMKETATKAGVKHS